VTSVVQHCDQAPSAGPAGDSISPIANGHSSGARRQSLSDLKVISEQSGQGAFHQPMRSKARGAGSLRTGHIVFLNSESQNCHYSAGSSSGAENKQT